MPSARRQRRMQKKKKWNVNFSLAVNKKIVLYFSLAFCFAIFFYISSILTKTHFWNGKDKLAVAVRLDKGAGVLLFAPEYEELVTIYFPEHTEIDVARELGIWKIESLWALGNQEKMGGKLLSDSITKHFKFPVAGWADEEAMGFSKGGLKNLYTAGFGNYKTNLTLGDRVRMAWFSFNVPNTRHVEIQLANTGYLEKVTLSDGTEGYRKVDPPPQKVLALFADSAIGKSSYAVSIQDATGKSQVARNVGSVVEVLGAKIAAVDREEEKEVDCLVKGNSDILVKRIVKLFSCTEEDGESNFDLEIFLGSEFAKRF
jgi:hypothetical protein